MKKQPKAKRPGTFHRDEPDLPAEFESTDAPGQLFEATEMVRIQERQLQDLEQTSLKIDALQVEGSLLERIQLSGAQLGSMVCKDVRLEGCDLANVRAHRVSFVRVELVECRLTGFRATALDWQDVLVRKGDLGYAQIFEGKFRNCEFDTCSWPEADLRQTDLSGSVFRSCNLTRADLRGAKLQNTDFRTSEVEGVVIGMTDLEGAIVDAAQAMVFARVLGLQIR